MLQSNYFSFEYIHLKFNNLKKYIYKINFIIKIEKLKIQLQDKHTLVIGILISITSYLLSFTIIVPLFLGLTLCMPIPYIISIFTGTISNESSAHITEGIISLLLISSMVLYAIQVQVNQSKKIIWLIVLLQFSFIETLGFYWYWGNFLSYRGDGQLFFLFYDSYQYTAIIFIPFYGLQWLFNKIPITKRYNNLNNRKINDEDKIKALMILHHTDTDEALQEIINSEGWTNEAKEAAGRILMDRKIKI